MSRVKKFLIGNTIKVTWVSSGVSPTDIYTAIRNSSDTMVNSVAMTDSGNGHYYSAYTLVNSLGFFVAETIATVSGAPYKNRSRFKAISGETDDG